MKNFLASLLFISTLVCGTFSSATKAPASAQAGVIVEQQQAELLRASLRKARPQIPVGDVRTSSVPGLFEVVIAGGGDTVYMTKDGKYLITGTMYRIDDNNLVNMADERLRPERAAKLAAVKMEDMVVFSPQGKPKSFVWVFTDVDCSYCRRLHHEVPQMNEMGIEVRYLAYPRAGLASDSGDKMASIWCAKDPKSAFGKIINGIPLDSKLCETNPVASQYALGSALGVNGTPAIFKPDGTLLPGYMSAKELAKELGVVVSATPALLSAPVSAQQ